MPLDPWEDEAQVATRPPARDPWEAPPEPGPSREPAPVPPTARLDPWESPDAAPAAAPSRHWWEPAAAESPIRVPASDQSPELLAGATAQFTREFNLPGGRNAVTWHSLTQPIVQLAHYLTPQELAEGWDTAKLILSQKEGETWEDIQKRLGELPPSKPTRTQRALAGAQQAAAGAVNFFTSPLGALTLGTGALPAAAQKAISAIFVTQMIASLPDDVQTLAEGWYDQDPEKLAKGAAGLGLNATFITQGIRHGMADTAAPPIFREPPERLQLTEPQPLSEFGGIQLTPVEPERAASGASTTPTPEPAPPATQPAPPKLTVNENPPEAPNQPLSTIEQKYLAEDIRARRPISAAAVARSGAPLPEGYTLAGEHYVYEEPPTPETDAQRMAREQREAMASLRAIKEEEPPAPSAPEHTAREATPPATPRDPWEPAPQELGERPPDILDFIESNYPSGVRVPQMPDYDESFSQARGAAKEMLRRTSGEPLDQVLQELHSQGMYRRITSEGELLDAITSAGEARIGHAERTKAARDRLDDWLTKAIDATAPYSGDPFEGVTGAPVWLTKSLAHGALLAVRESIRLGRTVARALQEGLAWLRAQNPAGFHEGEARLWLSRAESKEWLSNLQPAPPLDKLVKVSQPASHEAPQRELQRRQQPGNPGGRELHPAREQARPTAAPGSPEHASELQRAATAAEANDAALRAYIAQLPRRENGLLDWRKMSGQQVDRIFQLENDRLDALQERRGIANRSSITYPPHQFQAEPAAGRPSVSVESWAAWADRTIAQGRKRLHTGLDPELLAAYAVKGSAILARGAHDFATWSGAMLSEFGETIREHLPALWDAIRQRAFSLQTSDEISDRVKAGIAQDLFYNKRGHAELTAAAETLLQQQGPEAAFRIFADPQSGVAMDGRNALGATLERHYRTLETNARAAGDTAAADAAADQQIKLWQTDVYGTEQGQGLASRQLYDNASPQAKLRLAQQVFEQSAGTTFEGIRPQVDVVATAIRQGHADAAGQIRIDPATNDAARAAVDETIANSEQTHKAVVMELAEPFASSPAILADARVQVRAKADELLNTAPRPPGLTAPQHLRAILDDLASRAATIASGHYQGAEPGITLRDKLQQRLGLDQAAATRLAAGMDTAFQAMVKKAAAKLSQRVATQRARQNGTLTADATDHAVDRAIREQLQKHNVQLGKLLEQHTAETVRDTQKTIADRIVDASGLTGPAADKLRETFNRRWNALSDAAKQARLKALSTAAGAKPLPPKLRSASADLIRLTRLGALDDAAFHDLVKKRLKLPAMSPEIARELVRRAHDLEKMPAGFLRDRASTQLLNWVYMKAGVKWIDIPMGMFYSNMLSGLSTAVKIPFENMNLLVGQTVIGLLRGRLGPVATVQAFGRGLKKGGLQSAEILKTGIVTGVREGEHPSSVMELKPFGEKGDIINYWKWFGREISALHVSTFKPAWEIKQSMVAYELARSAGLRGQAAQARAAELLANTPDRIAAAQTQASAELSRLGNKSTLDYRRRVLEILEQQREASMPGSTALARDFALRTTYLNKPYGLMGLISEGIKFTFQLLREQAPWAGRGVQSQIPFVTVAVNIVNEKLNWTPVGTFRAAAALRSGKLYGRPVMERGEVGDLLAKSILGSIVLGAAGTLAGDYIHGNGPSSPSRRKQLQATGWVPNSVGPIEGRYFSYLNTPMGAGLAWIGNWMDWHRYGKGETADGEARAAYALRGFIDTLINQPMLTGIRDMLQSLGNPDRVEGAASLERTFARTAGAFVVPNLVSQVDKFFDPTVYDSTGIKAALISQVPFVRRDNHPALNALGEPLQQGPFGQWTKAQTSDRLWRAIAARQAWIPEVPKDVIVGNKSDGPGQFRILTPDERYNYIRASARDIRSSLNPSTILSLKPDAARHYVATTVDEARARHKPGF